MAATSPTPSTASTNTRQRKPLAIPAGPMESPLLPGEEGAQERPQDAPREANEPEGYAGGRPSSTRPTETRTKRMQALLAEHGYKDRAAAIDRVSAAIGRRVESRNELDRADTEKVIDALEAEPVPA